MNVIEVMRQILTDYPSISDLISGDVHIDFNEESDNNYGLSSTGDSFIKSNIWGDQVRTDTMVLYATNQSANDYDRLKNSTFLLELGYYLETVKGQKVTGTINNVIYTGKIENVSIGNGMAWSKSADGQYLTYQLQIKVNYTLESEE